MTTLASEPILQEISLSVWLWSRLLGDLRCRGAGRREKALEVLADVHTHPGRWVEQSSIDRRHPMLPIVHHTALIVPCYGRASRWPLKGVGVYEYLGNFKWATHNRAGKSKRVSLSLW